MRTIVLISFWLTAIGGVLRLLLLAFVDYPRTSTYARWEDCLTLALCIGWCVWLGATLW